MNESDIDEKKIKSFFINKKIDLIPVLNKQKKVSDIIFWDNIFSNDKNFKRKKYKNLVVIMAGGFGTRMRPYTSILPKPLLSYNGKAMIDIIFDNFEKNLFYNFIVSLNYKSDLLKIFIKEKNNKNIKTIFEKIPLGTIGILSKLKNKMQDDLILTNCDTILNYNYSKILEFHKINKNIITLVCVKKKYQIPYGNCRIDKHLNLTDIREKPKIDLNVNIGFYVINKKAISLIPNGQKFDVTDLISKVIKKKLKVKTYIIKDEFWLDLGDLKNINLNK